MGGWEFYGLAGESGAMRPQFNQKGQNIYVIISSFYQTCIVARALGESYRGRGEAAVVVFSFQFSRQDAASGFGAARSAGFSNDKKMQNACNATHGNKLTEVEAERMFDEVSAR